MQKLDYPKNWSMHTGFYFEGKFYVLLTNQRPNARWSGLPSKFRLATFDGEVTEEFSENEGDYRRAPLMFPHPDYAGLNVGFENMEKHTVDAINLKNGKRFVAIKDVPHDGSYWDRQQWLHAKLGMVTHERYQHVRAVWNDSLIVATGQEASSRASMMMGPTAAAPVLATKGLETGYILAYQRGGGHRLLKASKKSITHLALAEDGCVFMGCTTNDGAFLFDFDVQ